MTNLEIKKATEFDCDPRTVRTNTKKYLCFSYTDSQTRRKDSRGFWVRYIETEELIDYLYQCGAMGYYEKIKKQKK